MRDGVCCAQAGRYFEALASFMVAKDAACAYKSQTSENFKIYAQASIHLALVYLMQKLPLVGLEIVEAARNLSDSIPILAAASKFQ